MIVGKSGTSEFYSGTRECLRRLYAAGGLAAFYRGFWLQVSRDIFSAGAYFLCYEYTFDRLHAAGWSNHGGVVASLAAGGLAGMCSWFVILPIDVIKSQVQAAAAQTGVNRKSAMQCLRSTFAQGGVRAFFAGCTPLLVRAFLTNSVIFVVYHQTLRHVTPVYFRPTAAITPEVKDVVC
jgi:solute carrier family 25 carnitine/acylcarnitine transporter 20/29